MDYVAMNSCGYDDGLIIAPCNCYNPGTDMVYFRGSKEGCKLWERGNDYLHTHHIWKMRPENLKYDVAGIILSDSGAYLVDKKDHLTFGEAEEHLQHCQMYDDVIFDVTISD